MRRKRGCPETTGEHKKEEIKLRRLEDELRDEEDIRDPEVRPKSRATLLSRTENEFVEEFQNTGSL